MAIHGPLTLAPVFVSEEGRRIECMQSQYFGFYALQVAMRSFLRAVNPCVAGHLLVDHELYGPAVTSFYTSAYHAIQSVLAFEGRVIVSDPHWPIPSLTPANSIHTPLAGLLTKRNAWTFEFRRRSHRVIWSEVAQAFPKRQIDRLPFAFENLFHYMYAGVYEPGIDMLELLRNQTKYRVKLEDRYTEFLELIAEVRHRSIYESFGSDPHVVEAIWNQDAFSTKGLNAQAQSFGEFATSLLRFVSSDLATMLKALGVNMELRSALWVSAQIPWFDLPETNAIQDPHIRASILEINNWARRQNPVPAR